MVEVPLMLNTLDSLGENPMLQIVYHICKHQFIANFSLKKHIVSHEVNRINCDYCTIVQAHEYLS